MSDFKLIVSTIPKYRPKQGTGTESDPVVGGFLPLQVVVERSGSWQFHARASCPAKGWRQDTPGNQDQNQGMFPIFDPPNEWDTPQRIDVVCDVQGLDGKFQRHQEQFGSSFWIITSYKVDEQGRTEIVRRVNNLQTELNAVKRLLGVV